MTFGRSDFKNNIKRTFKENQRDFQRKSGGFLKKIEIFIKGKYSSSQFVCTSVEIKEHIAEIRFSSY